MELTRMNAHLLRYTRMNAHLLRYIGVTFAEAERAANKPFGRT